VLPVVAHVVGVIEGGDAAALDDSGERRAAGAVDPVPPADIIGIGYAIDLVAGGELRWTPIAGQPEPSSKV
jgi:hypothetical protein